MSSRRFGGCQAWPKLMMLTLLLDVFETGVMVAMWDDSTKVAGEPGGRDPSIASITEGNLPN
jgi:hypothetical protein